MLFRRQDTRNAPPFCKCKNGKVTREPGSKSGRRKFLRVGLGHRLRQRRCRSGFDRAGRDGGSVTVVVNLGPEDRYFFRSVNSDFNSVSVDSGDFDVD